MIGAIEVRPYSHEEHVGELIRISKARLPGEDVVRRDEHADLLMHRVVAVHDGTVVAYADMGDVAVVDDASTMHVWIIVDPEWSRRGVASHLLDEAIAFAETHGRDSLVTAVDRTDEVATQWLRKQSFRESGDLDVRRRAPRSAPRVADGAQGSSVEKVPASVAGNDAAFLEQAASAASSRLLPDGTRMTITSDVLKSWYFDKTSVGSVYRTGARGNWTSFASVQPARSAGFSVEPIWSAPGAESDLRHVVGRLASDADALGHELVMGFSPLSEPALAEISSQAGFVSAGGRITWRRAC